MEVMQNDPGICGVAQFFYAGTVKFNTEDADTGVVLCKIPHDCRITRAIAVVDTAFDAGTTNVLTVGTTTTNADELLGSGDITEGTAGIYNKMLFVETAKDTKIVAKYTQTGTAATAGKARIYLETVGIPEVTN